MTELEALRRVAEAARKKSRRIDSLLEIARAAIARGASVEDALPAIGEARQLLAQLYGKALLLDALPAPAAEPVGEVVEVRAGVYYHRVSDTFSINGVRWPDGTWGISESSELVATIRARVPLPRVPEVVGEVEG